MRRRGIGRARPSLLGTAARTAVVAGTATAVAGNVAAGQQARAQQAAAQQQAAAPQPAAAPPPPPPPPPTGAVAEEDEMVRKLRQLAELRDQGILTDDEFSAKKAQLLGI
jgi:hypothetical protein